MQNWYRAVARTTVACMCVSVQHSVCASRIFLSLRVIETRSRTCSSFFVISSYTKKGKLREPAAISLFFVLSFFFFWLLINGTVQHKHKMLPQTSLADYRSIQRSTNRYNSERGSISIFPWQEPLCFFTQGQQCVSALFGLHKAYPSDRSDSIHLWPCVWGCFVRRWKHRQHRETFPRRITEIDIVLGIWISLKSNVKEAKKSCDGLLKV